MANQYTAIIEPGESGWWIAMCPEVPEANGQGATSEEARQDLALAIAFVLDYLREKALKDLPPEALRQTVTVA